VKAVATLNGTASNAIKNPTMKNPTSAVDAVGSFVLNVEPVDAT
jgi:hypothetical protein